MKLSAHTTFGLAAQLAIAAVAQAANPHLLKRQETQISNTPYGEPIVAHNSTEKLPVPHQRVSGYFNGTDVDFNIYLPLHGWHGRFFQPTYPTQDAEADDETIAFGITSGAYVLQNTGTLGYESDEAAATYSRVIAREYYNANEDDVIYGYIYGGSGGSYQTVGAMEETDGTWHGAVTYVQAVPVSIPLVPASRAFAGMVLRNKSSYIIDAVRPGSHVDLQDHLTDTELSIFHEANLMGVPRRKWEDFAFTADTRTLDVLTSTVYSLDPDYCHDFWNENGYLGSKQSDLGDIVRAAVIDMNTSISAIEYASDGIPSSVRLGELPVLDDTRGFVLNVLAPNGTFLIPSLMGSIDQNLQTFNLTEGTDTLVLKSLEEDGKVNVNNRCFIALMPYYRYKLPSRSGFYGFDQFMDNNHEPLYPQRDIDVASLVAQATSGANHTGIFSGKMIVVDNLWDSDAYAWHADWYRNVVCGDERERCDDKYRLWYNDHADHNEAAPEGVRRSYLVDYKGIVRHALIDLSNWVEQGITPPPSTQYNLSNSQIEVPKWAKDRRGVQPTVQLTCNGQASDALVTTSIGSPVELLARVQAAQGAGQIISVEWDYFGTGDFVQADFRTPSESVEVKGHHTYDKPGTYFVGVRVAAERNGVADSLAKVMNIDRVRVVVH